MPYPFWLNTSSGFPLVRSSAPCGKGSASVSVPLPKPRSDLSPGYGRWEAEPRRGSSASLLSSGKQRCAARRRGREGFNIYHAFLFIHNHNSYLLYLLPDLSQATSPCALEAPRFHLHLGRPLYVSAEAFAWCVAIAITTAIGLSLHQKSQIDAIHNGLDIARNGDVWCDSDVEGHYDDKRNPRRLRRRTDRCPTSNQRTGEHEHATQYIGNDIYPTRGHRRSGERQRLKRTPWTSARGLLSNP